MHDEAATHFMGMIDQTTLGHSFLKKELGVVPTVGWQVCCYSDLQCYTPNVQTLFGYMIQYMVNKIHH